MGADLFKGFVLAGSGRLLAAPQSRGDFGKGPALKIAQGKDHALALGQFSGQVAHPIHEQVALGVFVGIGFQCGIFLFE